MSRIPLVRTRGAGHARRLPARRQLCLALAMALATFHAASLAQLPAGAQVVSGTASLSVDSAGMAIRNSPNAILDWQSFSIGAGKQVHFEQADASSQVLNRVVGVDASRIFGSLSSNGRVWLINPNGVLFGPGARVDVAGLLASTLSVSNADFLSGRGLAQVEAGRTGAAVLNQGRILAGPGGQVWLLGSSVRNEGLIQAPGGQILLAAGSSLEFVDAAAPNVVVRLSAPEHEAVNLGTLLASGPGGSAEMLGGMVNQQGMVRADSTGIDSAGLVVLRSQGELVLGDSSVTSASAQGSGAGGQVVAAASASTLVSGQVAATSSQGQGGQVLLLGQRVGIHGQALVDASGATAGGSVLVGGDYQGSNPAIANAQLAYVGSGSRLSADARAHGDGGRVIVWSDSATRVYGSLSARGGPSGGDGGLIETSGAYLDARPAAIDATAAKGRPGTWLLDPNDIIIAPHDGVNSHIDEYAPPILTTTDDSGIVDTQFLANAVGQGQQVVVRTGSAGGNSQPGDITVAGDVSVIYPPTCDTNVCGNGSLTLQAHRNITINQGVQVTAQNGAMPLSLQAGTGAILLQQGSRLDSGTGNIVLDAGQGIALEAGATLKSSATGDALRLRSASFDNQAGSGALFTPNGRWLVHTDGMGSTQMGGLSHDFVQFHFGPDTNLARETGNGLLYAESLNLQGSISRVYDGTARAELDNSTRISGEPGGYQANVDQAGVGSFSDPNVGAGKLITRITAPGLDVKDGAGKPVYGYSTDYSGDITPAPLTFTASTAWGYVAQPLPVLGGSVSGFVKGESLPARWSTSAVNGSAPGRYPVTGSVDSANYAFNQLPGNATALTLLADNRPQAAAQQALRDSDASISAAVRLARPPVDAFAASGLLDLSALGRGQLFSPVNVGAMTQADLSGLLDSRREFKRKLFADSISRLEIDPSLADVKPCTSAEEAGSGNCRITPEQVRQVQAERQAQAAAPHQAALPQIERKIAVLFGINDYGDRRIPRLESAIPDVDAVARVLAASMGYEVRVLRNPGKADIVRTLNQLSTEAGPADSVLVYYAGHGYALEKRNAGYWLPADAPADEPKRWLSNHDIARLLSAYPSRQMALVSDSCYSGAFAREALDMGAQPLAAGEVLDRRSVVVLTSGGDEPVTDEGKDGHSIFAWNLMQSLSSVRGWVAGNTVFRQVQAGVTSEFPQTPHYGVVTEAGHQQGGEYLFEVR